MAYFKIWKDTQGYYRLTLKGGNHETIFTTEGYVSKSSALNAKSVVTSTNALTQVIDNT